MKKPLSDPARAPTTTPPCTSLERGLTKQAQRRGCGWQRPFLNQHPLAGIHRRGSLIVSDGLACFSAVKKAGCDHTAIVTGGGPDCISLESFTWVNTMIANVKRSMDGTYHAIDARHFPRYLAEFCYRFNRRFKLEDMLPRFGYIAARTPPMPNRLLKLAENYELSGSKGFNSPASR